MTSVEVRAGDGWTLKGTLRSPERPRGIAVLLHAMMVDGRTWDRPTGGGFASFLQTRSWATLTIDLRGHGSSGPLPREGGTWGYDDLVQFDVPAAVQLARKSLPNRPVLVVGHSLGGHTAIAAAGSGAHEHRPDAHILLSTNTWMPSLEPDAARRRRKARSLLGLLTIASLLGRFPSRLVRMGPAEEALPYLRDLRRFWTEDRWASRDGRADYLAGQRRVGGPVVSLIGVGDDLMAHAEGARRWAAGIGAHGATVRVVGKGDLGLPWDPDHMETLTDPRSQPAWGWALDQVEGGLGL